MRLAPNQKGAQPVALTGVDSVDRVPSFAPTSKASILAFVSGTGGKQLCFATLGPNTLNPDCTSHPGWSLGRQVAWSTDGASDTRVRRPERQERQRVRTDRVRQQRRRSRPTRPTGGTATSSRTSTSPGQGVIAGAFSPNGKQVAVVSNIGTFAFHVVLAPRTDFTLSPPAKVTSIGACQVDWRSDGQALAVMNAAGTVRGERARRHRRWSASRSSTTRTRSRQTPRTRPGSRFRSVAESPAARGSQ